MPTITVRRSRDDLLDDYEMLRSEGYDWHQCAARLRIPYPTFERAMLRARKDGDPRARRPGEARLPVPPQPPRLVPPPIFVRPCGHCGNDFETVSNTRKYCSGSCIREVDAARKRASRRKYCSDPCSVPDSHPTHCRCGITLTEDQRQQRRVYHDDECRRVHSNADRVIRKRASKARRRANSVIN
ncbi:MAG TPA: hypothetical protein VGJ13_04970 [Pseudonocardiaceae bacterium]|jgi:hypothetical protein